VTDFVIVRCFCQLHTSAARRAAAESSACGRGDAASLTSILDRGIFLDAVESLLTPVVENNLLCGKIDEF